MNAQEKIRVTCKPCVPTLLVRISARVSMDWVEMATLTAQVRTRSINKRLQLLSNCIFCVTNECIYKPFYTTVFLCCLHG